MEKYDPKKIEEKWQKNWAENTRLYEADEKSKKPKFYCLDMFPYPSGDGLHVGHVEGYTASDIYSRYQRMQGKNILHPMGWDAFGLPAENYAIKTGVYPKESTQKNIKNFTWQIKSLGLSYDWSREIDTSSPEYYKWTQWFFLFLYEKGLAYRKKGKVNWCESCQTVLANEQVEDGACERCKNNVIQKDLEQWYFKITNFAEDLIAGLDKIDWPESTKIAQKNWIGKSIGAEVDFKVDGSNDIISVFTTRVDTIFSGTFLVLAPEHPLVEKITKSEEQEKVGKYIQETSKKTDIERLNTEKEKTGVFTGSYVVNPASGEKIPVWIADFVLLEYGTGAVFADAHDERDFEMAKKYRIPLKISIKPEDEKLWKKVEALEECFPSDGSLVNSGEFDGLSSAEARKRIPEWLSKKGLGRAKVTYKLRDWLISRQRYWGAPIPMVQCEKCGWVPVPKKDLPVLLPEVEDYRPKGTSPLGTNPDFVNTSCPKCGGAAKRETDTMDTFVCSSWYFFRFSDPKNKEEFASKEKIKKWLPVDLYIGGAEHTVLHLLYSRFFTKALNKHGYIDFDEPFTKLRHQGIVLAEDGRKMSKSLGNVINPDEIVEKYGADTLRLYEMFMGPLEDSKNWDTKSIVGLKRFLDRLWNICDKRVIEDKEKITTGRCIALRDGNDLMKRQQEKAKAEVDYVKRLINKTIKKVSEDIENFKFNTAISEMMIFVNTVEQFDVDRERFEKFLILLSPFVPHITEEIWQEQLGHKNSIFLEKWPQYDKNLIKDEEVTLIIQINGKVRDQIQVAAGSQEEEVKKLALSREKIIRYTQGKKILKTVFVKDRLINFVI